MRNKRRQYSPLAFTAMQDALAHFQECQKLVMADRGPLLSAPIEEWVRNITLKQPLYLLRDDSLQGLTESIYTSEGIREFVFDLGFLFFSTLGLEHPAQRLTENLIEGLTLDGVDDTMSMIPLAVRSSMVDTSMRKQIEPLPWWKRWLGFHQPDLRDFFVNNKPLLVVYLIYLTNTSTPDAPTA